MEKVLRCDPAAIYARMDFTTRHRYRHIIEDIAKYSPRSEHDVARQVIELAAQDASAAATASQAGHVGYYLINKGRPKLEKEVSAKMPLRHRLLRCIYRWPLFFYLVPILFITAIFTGGLLIFAASLGAKSWMMGTLAILLVLCGSQLALMIVNWFAAFLTEPYRMPRMDFSQGIPPEFKTIVVIPTMLASKQGVLDLLEGLEVRYMANRDQNIQFALLTDFRDAQEQAAPDDANLLQMVRQGIEALNLQYSRNQHDIFFLFHRPRLYNPSEKLWMGRERKRGKLADFNALLRGSRTDQFSLIVGDIATLKNVKFVITLDSDTQLPRDSARQLAATMVHPLVRDRNMIRRPDK